jgi:hypothetical protein
LNVSAKNLTKDPAAGGTENFRQNLENATNYAEVWQTVKDTSNYVLSKRRGGMLLLSLQVGAYYPLGTNNIVLNRHLVDIVEANYKQQKSSERVSLQPATT